MDLNEYHRLWNLGYPESECVRGAEDAYEELQWEKQRQAEYREHMEQQYRAADREEMERNQ